MSRIVNRLDGGLIIAALLVLFAVQALLRPGLPPSADLILHMYRTMEFEQIWAAGLIVPRWSPNLAYGYGYPLFIFAPPLPYALGVLFQLGGLTLESAFKLLIIFTFFLYAIGIYLLAREIYHSVAAGLIAAAAFAFAPFALREALLSGGNVPQFLAIGLFPWTLWAVTRAIRTQRWSWAILAGILYAAIMLSHLFQVLIFSPVFGLYILTLVILSLPHLRSIGPQQRLKAILLSFGAIPIGLLLSAFFWLPAFIERNFTRAQAEIYLEKSPFFVRYPYWPELVAWIQPLDFRAANPYTPLTLGVITLGLAGLGLAAGLVMAWRFLMTEEESATLQIPVLISFFGLVAAAGIFMTLGISQRIWEIVEILQVSEFPWRMLSLANLGLAVVAGAAILWLPDRIRGPATALCLLIQLVAVAPYLYPVSAFVKRGDPTIADQINYERSSQSIGTTTLGEYLPRSVTHPPSTSPLVPAFQANTYPERLDRTSLPAKSTATLLEQNAALHQYRIDSPEPFMVRFYHYNFPGWRARLNGQPVQIEPEADSGLMLVEIPAGQHTLTLSFGETPLRAIATTMSGITALGLIIFLIILRTRRSRRQSTLPSAGGVTAGESSHNLGFAVTLTAAAVILLAAFWLKPLLRPLFTLESPPSQILPAQHQTDIQFANGIKLLGYDINRTILEPDQYLQVVLYWQTDGAPHRVNLQPFVHLDRLDNFSTTADATNYTPGDVTTETVLPTFHWDNYRYVRDEHDLIVPSDAPAMPYAVRVGLIDPDQAGQLVPLAAGSDDTIRIDTIHVVPAGNQTLTLAQSPQVSFGNSSDTIHLAGFETTGQTPEQLNFSLLWNTTTKPKNEYTVFAQLLDSDNNRVAGFDSPPLNGAYPTSTWLPDQAVLEQRYLPLANLSSGDYRLIVGLYDPLTGQRLITNSGTDFAELTSITIQ